MATIKLYHHHDNKTNQDFSVIEISKANNKDKVYLTAAPDGRLVALDANAFAKPQNNTEFARKQLVDTAIRNDQSPAALTITEKQADALFKKVQQAKDGVLSEASKSAKEMYRVQASRESGEANIDNTAKIDMIKRHPEFFANPEQQLKDLQAKSVTNNIAPNNAAERKATDQLTYPGERSIIKGAYPTISFLKEELPKVGIQGLDDVVRSTPLKAPLNDGGVVDHFKGALTVYEQARNCTNAKSTGIVQGDVTAQCIAEMLDPVRNPPSNNKGLSH